MNLMNKIGRLFDRNTISRRRAPARRQLNMESLGDRLVPANISLNAGIITISGSAKADVAKVELEVHNPETPFDDRIRASISNQSGSTTIWYDLYKPGSTPILKE
jgi:hypothetical protein